MSGRPKSRVNRRDIIKAGLISALVWARNISFVAAVTKGATAVAQNVAFGFWRTENMPLFVSATYVEALVKEAAELRSSQMYVEAITQALPELRSSQVYVEGILQFAPELWTSQVYAEAMVQEAPDIRASQIYIEVVRSHA